MFGGSIRDELLPLLRGDLWSGVECCDVVLGGSIRDELSAAAWRSIEWCEL